MAERLSRVGAVLLIKVSGASCVLRVSGYGLRGESQTNREMN